MKNILSMVLSLLLVLSVLASCSFKNQEIYYDYDIGEYITVGEYSTAVDKDSQKYDEYYHSFYTSTFADTLDEEITIGTVEKWDTLTINYACYHGGEMVDGGTELGRELTVGSGNFSIAGFEEKLIGASIGKNTTFELDIPEDYYIAELAGKTVSFEVFISSAVRPGQPNDEDAINAGFASLADYEKAAEKYAVSLYLYYEVYDATEFNSYPEKETQALLDSLLKVYERQCAEEGITLEQKAGSYGWTLDTYKEKLVEGIQKNYANMPRDLVSHYILGLYGQMLTADDIKSTRNDIIKEIDTSLEEAGYSEIEIQRRAAYEKALDVLYGQYEVQ